MLFTSEKHERREGFQKELNNIEEGSALFLSNGWKMTFGGK
jgi:hypothetical protein